MGKLINERLLILDDEPLIGRILALMGEELGIDSMAVSNSQEFFDVLGNWEPTHIILDLVMPGMDGVEVLNLLGKRKCLAQLAISSGVGGRIAAAAQISASEHGLDNTRILSKPIKLETLKGFIYSDSFEEPAHEEKRQIDRTESLSISSADIKSAINGEQFRLEYQPKIHCDSRRVSGFEALIRWDSPTKGLIMPDSFIEKSEELGLIGLITDQVVDHALNWHKDAAELDCLSVSINISAKSLQDLAGLGKRGEFVMVARK